MKNSVPLYHHLKTEILRGIEGGRWQRGEAISSEAELAKMFGVSRITVRQAIGDLVSLGYLIRKQGVGTFVADRPNGLFAASRLYGFAEELRSRGYEVALVPRSIEQVRCPEAAANELNLMSGEMVMKICRVAEVEGWPIFHETSYLVPPPRVTLSEITERSALYNHIYGFYEQHGVKLAFGKQRVSASLANLDDVTLLGLRLGDPILMIRRLTADQSGVAVEYSEVRYRSDRYEFEVSLVRERNGGEGN